MNKVHKPRPVFEYTVFFFYKHDWHRHTVTQNFSEAESLARQLSRLFLGAEMLKRDTSGNLYGRGFYKDGVLTA